MRERAALRLRQMQPDIARLHGLRAKINNSQPLFIPVKERNYFKFELEHNETNIESMLDVVIWLENGLADPDTLALNDIDPFYLGYLFALKVPSLSIPGLAEGAYQVKEVRIVSGAEIATEKIRIPSHVGELLFDDIPESILPVVAFTLPPTFKIRLKFILGTSRIKFTRLVSVRCGDLLLIQKYNPHVYVADKRAFGFNLSEEGIMINDEEDHDEEIDHEEEIDHQEEIEHEDSDHEDSDHEETPHNVHTDIADKVPVRFNKNKINLKINFLLQQQDMTLDEISHLHAGSLVTLLPNAEKKIIMTVNNQVYAKGELIQVGDNLAVEVTEVYFDRDTGN